jgi:indoleamine 2,3-dioxygenase
MLAASGLSQSLIEAVDTCRRRAAVQKKVLEAEMAVWSIVDDQKRHELERSSAVLHGHVNLGEQKIMQRGWVGNDGVG